MILGIINTITHGRLTKQFMSGNWSGMIDTIKNLNTHSIQAEVILMGIILIIISGITILTRCMGAINEEKRMKTWDDLLMTGMKIEKIAASKMWSILQASGLFIVSYAVPLLVFSIIVGPGSVVATSICFLITWAVVYFAAEIGIGISLADAQKEVIRRR